MDILDILSSDNYIPLNKSLAKEIGIVNTIVFGALCGYQRVFKNDWFFREQDKIMEDTCLSEYFVRNAIKELSSRKLIFVEKKGLPAKYYFKINDIELINLLTTSGAKSDTTCGDKNDTTNKNKINNKETNINISKEKFNSFVEIEKLDIPTELKEQIIIWLEYKMEKKKNYQQKGFNGLVNKFMKAYKEYGIKCVVSGVEDCIASNYDGIFFKEPNKNAPTQVVRDYVERTYTKEELESVYTDIDTFSEDDL